MQIRESGRSRNENQLAPVLAALRNLGKGDTSVRLPAESDGMAGLMATAFNDVAEANQRMTNEMAAMVAGLRALARGDAAVRLPIEWTGVAGRVAEAFNQVVEMNQRMSEELDRLSRVVGKEGQLNRRGSLGDASGFWRTSIESVNALIDDLVHPTRETARVIGAVAKGDLSQTMATEIDDRPLQGEFLRSARTINKMVNQLGSFASEVTRVAREVGTEGRLGGQADVPGVAGTWKDLTDSVNSMASNLTGQVRNIADVTTAVAMGDLSKKITVDVKGEILELKNTINTMVDQLRSFASEVTRVAREVGTEGKLGGQARVEGVSGTWKDLTDSVNSMAGNLTGQVRNIADVTTAVASGDLSKKITVDVQGEFLELKNTVNTMVDQLRSFASEVTRVAREVGTEGKLGGQARVEGVSGTWKDLTDSVNSMAGNLTGQVRNIADVTTAVASGDLSKKITVDVKGEILELKNTINTMVDQLRAFASEVTRVAREVGTEGKLGGQADVPGVAGTWKDLTDSVNSMASNLTGQVRNIADVTKAVASGDLSKKITVDVKGEILELKNTVNTMVDQLSSFAAEVTRVAREVGTEGKLGGQARVTGVSGTWKDLTDSVNFMAGNLTSQVRGIAKVVTAVANGDLKQKLTVEAKGEIAALADTINSMTDTLATFADQVTTVAREVGVEGKLGGQAKVPGAAGTWKGLTENVNQLAANLTTQVRAIAEVTKAVTQGDLTRSITVEAQGEVAALKDKINEMIRNLKDTTHKNTEQDWLKTNLAKFSRMLQGQKDLNTVGRLILSELCPVVAAQQAEFYVLDGDEEYARLTLLASYASEGQRALHKQLDLGEGLVGQCALEKRKIVLTDVPPDYIRIASGLGAAIPQNILVLPIVFEGQVKGVLELASFERFNRTHQAFLDELTESIGIVLNTIEANMRTEGLLKQSQSLAEELQSRQLELQQTNQALQEKAGLLAHQNEEVERKNREVEQARQALEEKAEQLALTSKYKSEFLANMSHELRTPLNSLLILADQLCKNPEGNLSRRQIGFARAIHSSGNDLLTLINDILDLSKIESGTVVVDPSELRLDDLRHYVERTFRPVAESRNVDFLIQLDARLPRSIVTDSKRLQQILKNLLSNAFKFTHQGQVALVIEPAEAGHAREVGDPNGGADMLAFSVRDTGIGIPPEKQQIIFEAFQQADGSTSRKYGGTGLGLAISRELSQLLGGKIRLTSVPKKGSAFTLYLPRVYTPARLPRRPALEAGPPAGASLPGRTGEADGPTSSATVPMLASDFELPPPVDEIGDDRANLHPGDRTLLIVENDLPFARVLLETAREKGFKGIVTSFGALASALAHEYRPEAITLDLFLPDIDGWRVLNRLKGDLATRHIPIHVISTDEAREQAASAGAAGFLPKPIQGKDVLERFLDGLSEHAARPGRNVLVVDADSDRRRRVIAAIDGADVRIREAADVDAVPALLDADRYDCLVFGAGAAGLDLARLGTSPPGAAAGVPVIVYDPDDRVTEDGADWKRQSGRGFVRRVRSPERLLDVASLVLHRPVSALTDDQRRVLEELHRSDRVLRGKKVLIVDDDMRNIFAVTTILEDFEMAVVSAENGRDAIRTLRAQPDVDIVLMDIMMPELDGIATMQEIRRIPELRQLPIIAVTAKAMKGDRERCLAAGAWDYLSKPVDTDQMLAVLRAWLHR
ncbi:diguanylate cyclase [Sulfurifustis variabilis]|uniref:histidine kinase n=1 Tax=Sulfurifustis variabilis TaxID=1675686 RepID=A0A1B4V8W4_9GAMM|nr:HAMP domain-containing protein [Sulfurifustis variabilis]BAU49082.1 diguanylate cyclase [Sulfurifustis variabilis]